MSAWLLWSGHYTPLLIGFGVLSCALTVFLCRRMGIVDRESLPITAGDDILRYLPWLIWEIAKSNGVVVRAILRGKTQPQWVELLATQKTELGIATYANSITLTPGTVTVDTHGPLMHVHALLDETAEGLKTGEMDRRVTRMEKRLRIEAGHLEEDAEDEAS